MQNEEGGRRREGESCPIFLLSFVTLKIDEILDKWNLSKITSGTLRPQYILFCQNILYGIDLFPKFSDLKMGINIRRHWINVFCGVSSLEPRYKRATENELLNISGFFTSMSSPL